MNIMRVEPFEHDGREYGRVRNGKAAGVVIYASRGTGEDRAHVGGGIVMHLSAGQLPRDVLYAPTLYGKNLMDVLNAYAQRWGYLCAALDFSAVPA